MNPSEKKALRCLGRGGKMEMTARDHALLFAALAKSVIQEIGVEKGEPLIRQGVREYGRQRGKRMALRAGKYGHALTMDNYFAYGEWAVPKNEMHFKFVEKAPHARMHICRCPWHETWKENRVLEFGKYFCQEIDEALVRGFNPDLVLQVNSTRTNGGECCDFIFRDAGLSFFKFLGLAFKKKVRPGKAAVMPWEYHCGHLYQTMGRSLRRELGERADGIMDHALKDTQAFFDDEQITTIKAYANTDFETLP